MFSLLGLSAGFLYSEYHALRGKALQQPESRPPFRCPLWAKLVRAYSTLIHHQHHLYGFNFVSVPRTSTPGKRLSETILAHGFVGPSARPPWAYLHLTRLTGIISRAVRPISHEGVWHNVSGFQTYPRDRRSAPSPTVSRSLRMAYLYKMRFRMSI